MEEEQGMSMSGILLLRLQSDANLPKNMAHLPNAFKESSRILNQRKKPIDFKISITKSMKSYELEFMILNACSMDIITKKIFYP